MSISVVIPAYNASAFIADTLRSVLRQTLPPLEILVIDDGSTDDTAAIAESFAPAVRVISRSNSRQAASRNFGVQAAVGAWIAFIDADDLWEKDKLEKQMSALAGDARADLCYTARVHFEQHGDGLRRTLVVPVPPPSGLQWSLFRNTTFLPGSVVIRRSAFLASGGFDTAYTIVEDWDLWLRLLHSGTRFVACPEPLLLYRMHSGSVSRRADVALRESLAIFRMRVMPHLPLHSRWFRYNRIRSEHEAVASMVLRSGGDRRYLGFMAVSVLRDPLHYSHRYKVLAHMLFTRLSASRSPRVRLSLSGDTLNLTRGSLSARSSNSEGKKSRSSTRS